MSALTTWRPRLAEGTAPVLVVLVALLIGLALAGPAYADPSGYLALLKRAAPLMILAIGQYFVIVSGGFDLSVGSLVTAEVVIAARLIDGQDSATGWVIPLLLGVGVLIGLVNGLITTRLLVPSFIVTLGMLLVLDGAVFLWTGGAPRGALSPSFRVFGRGGVDVPVLGLVPWSVVILLVVLVTAVLFMRGGIGRTLVAVGDNEDAVRLAGGKVEHLKILAFVLSGLLAALAAILLGGFAGVSAQVGQGLEFRAITAVVLGGVLLGGGRGSVVAAAAGALSLEALFSLLNLLGVSGALESAVQGVIIIAAVAYASLGSGLRHRLFPRKPNLEPAPR
ncbi:monosaccharide ABC transporter membrane protein, CUT2 family [Actinokineospora alba]|uniref:Autoinducer 2 import system permease protein LsrD n=1 Tax=Actinokineospora alba TaxID=504798 RepID=A0A1H0NNE8_9PSEU|nr:ABC transporter permease [Actinokineospora alba]TDP68779.1 ribose transport system permease protein [Actinokineospora alba]SDH86516.1 ribose transport system permease protein [Actinokineospora alba]SDO94078.1 monosaccharide ABC transporter membrane protein, CUT2 family [Actinokineospora alba]